MTGVRLAKRLYRHKRGHQFFDRCLRAAQWTFRACRFEDGAVGMCGRDDKWLGFTGEAGPKLPGCARISPRGTRPGLRQPAERAHNYVVDKLRDANLQRQGVEWVHRKTSTDPLVNVAMLCAAALLGWLEGRDLFSQKRHHDRCASDSHSPT